MKVYKEYDLQETVRKHLGLGGVVPITIEHLTSDSAIVTTDNHGKFYCESFHSTTDVYMKICEVVE